MVCMVILELQEKPGGRGEVIDLIADFLPDTRQRDGYIEILTLANTEGDGVVLVEKWESRAHYDAYLGWRVERGDIDRIMSLCAAPPSIRYFDLVDV